MKFIQGNDRTQTHLFPVSLDQSIDPDNEVRLIDLFVESLPLADYGFKMVFVENGRPAYHPGDLLKLFIYGYMNKVRTTRDLEKECKRNIEVIWLMKSLQPDHNTIANFRREINTNQQRKDHYRQIEQQMKESGATQVSTSDPESRLLVTGNKSPEVVYVVQVTTDAEHCLPIDYKVTNSIDNRAMGAMHNGQRAWQDDPAQRICGLY